MKIMQELAVKNMKEQALQKINAVMDRITRNGNKKPVEAPPPTWQNASEQDKQVAGWVSPVYSQSRAVSLDPVLLARNRCLLHLTNTREAESFRVLRTRVLQRTQAAGASTILVTSALAGEGKTVSAINLSMAIAREFQHTVMLVDADLRKQNIHKYLGFSGERGLIDHLVGTMPLSELITWPGIEKMTLISGGRLVHESAEILGSPRMFDLVAAMKSRYPNRYVIFDAPPVFAGADVLTLAPLVDMIIVVVRAGKTSLDEVARAVQYLPKEKIMGFVLNGSTSPHASYYYGLMGRNGKQP
jgi:non-specific protein-tyrosine kinase